jgi:hypothetical protein
MTIGSTRTAVGAGDDPSTHTKKTIRLPSPTALLAAETPLQAASYSDVNGVGQLSLPQATNKFETRAIHNDATPSTNGRN